MDQKGNRTSSVTGDAPRDFTFDARGNMTLYDGKTLTYNADNRLMSVTEGGSAVATYTYNGFGQRISKNVTATDETTLFLWDFDGNIIAEYDGEGALKAEYMYRGANRLAMADSAGEVYFYQNDRLGTPLAITDKDNNAVWEATYLPFGQAMVNPNSTVENNFRFPGQYYDEETGLHYNYHRYYDPRTGRYVTADPIGLEGGINLFVYVQNNPINLIDPYGLEMSDILPGIGKAIVEGAKGGAYATGQAANATVDIAMNGHPLAQVALGVALVSVTAPAAMAAGYTASTSTLYLSSAPAIYNMLMGPIKGNPPITVTLREGWEIIEMMEEYFFGDGNSSLCK